MKATKIMVTGFTVFILTWLTLAFIGYMLSDTATFREVCASAPVIMIMIIVGWIPSMVVASDLDQQL